MIVLFGGCVCYCLQSGINVYGLRVEGTKYLLALKYFLFALLYNGFEPIYCQNTPFCICHHLILLLFQSVFSRVAKSPGIQPIPPTPVANHINCESINFVWQSISHPIYFQQRIQYCHHYSFDLRMVYPYYQTRCGLVYIHHHPTHYLLFV